MKKFFDDLFGVARVAGRVAALALALASSPAMGQKVTLVPSDASPMENAGAITLTATADSAPSADITITVTSSASYLRVPAANTLTIASGATASTGSGLSLTLVDDIVAGQDRTAVLSATIASTDTGAAAPDDVTITIVEDDELRMNLQTSSLWREGSEEQACVTFSTPFAGSITMGFTATATALGEIFDPTASTRAEITENNYEDGDLALPNPPSVTAVAGNTQVCFEIGVRDNDESDGPRFFTLSFGDIRTETIKFPIVGDNTAIQQIADDDNTPATGAPAVTAADNADLTMAGPNEDSLLTAARGAIDDDDGLITFAPTWVWQQGDAADGVFTDIISATAATFAPLQAHVGKFLRACATFDDYAGKSETRCWTSVAAVVNVDDAPVAMGNTIHVPVGGSYTFSADDFLFADEDDDALVSVVIEGAPTAGTLSVAGISLTANSAAVTVSAAGINNNSIVYQPASGQSATAGYATFTFNVTANAKTSDNDAAMTIDLVPSANTTATGAPTVTATTGTAAYDENVELTASATGVTDANGIPAHTRIWQWQSAAAASSTPTASAYADIPGAAAANFTPRRVHVGQYIRVCLRFTDGIGTTEGGDAASPTLCSVGAIIARANSVSVPTTADESKPYVFKLSDFMFPEDTGNPQSITIRTAIASYKGTLHNGSDPVTAGATVTAAELRNGDLAFYPAGRFAAAFNFASFAYTVNYGGTDTETRTMNIHLVERLRLRLRVFLEGPLR